MLRQGARYVKSQVHRAHKNFYDFLNPYKFRSQTALGKKIDLSLDIGAVTFDEFYQTRHGDNMVGFGADGKSCVKISLKHDPRKKMNLSDEAGVIEFLATRSCVTSPSSITKGTLSEAQKKMIVQHLGCPEDIEGAYFILPRYTTGVSAVLGDIILAVIEQKRLGVFHADIKPNNVGMTASHAVLFDYDQAEYLSPQQTEASNAAFFDWANKFVREKYKKNHIFSDFTRLPFEKIYADHFKDGAFNLQKTSLFKQSQSTRTVTGVYHTIKNAWVYADGARDLTSRSVLLDKIEVAKGERFLDVGCNTGLLSFYLNKRGANVYAVDIDPASIEIATMIAHITGEQVRFEHMDIDQTDILPQVDTVCLFSVLHHTNDVEGNAKKIAKACGRILIESRLVERGAKPREGAGWAPSSSWAFESIEHLMAYLEKIFPGFKVVKDHGLGDKARHIFELVKGTE